MRYQASMMCFYPILYNTTGIDGKKGRTKRFIFNLTIIAKIIKNVSLQRVLSNVD